MCLLCGFSLNIILKKNHVLVQCPSSSDILSHFGMSNLSRLTVGDLEMICPAVLTQVLLPSCPHFVTEDLPPLDYSGQLLHRFVCSALPSQILVRSAQFVVCDFLWLYICPGISLSSIFKVFGRQKGTNWLTDRHTWVRQWKSPWFPELCNLISRPLQR